MKKIYLLSLIALITFISSCKKDSSIGADILPADDLLNVKFSDTFTLHSKTLADTFLRTDKLSLNYLGVINDPQFGFQRASLALELDRPNSVFDDTLGPFTLDSVILLLKYNTIYGDTLVPQNFKVSTISNKIIETNSYFSNTSSFPAASLIGSVNNYYFNPSSRVKMATTDTVGSTNILRVKLNSTVGYSILNLGQTILRDSSQFKNSFPGIVIENSSLTGKCMAEIDINSSSSSMVIYYKDKNAAKKEMRLFTSLYKIVSGSIFSRQNGINLFDNTKSSTVQNVINSGLVSDSVNYLLGQGGTLVRLSLPTITNLSNIAVNKATIQLTQIQPNTLGSFTSPLIIILLRRNTNGQLEVIPTYSDIDNSNYARGSGPPPEGIGFTDSVYNDVFGNKMVRYSISVAKYVQKISKNLETNPDLFLAYYRSAGTDGAINLLNSAGFSYTPVRLIFAGPNYSDIRYRMKLNLTYTPIE